MNASFEKAAATLIEQLRSGPQRVGHGGPRRFLRVETFLPPFDPAVWLHGQNVEARVYWSDRERAFAMAGTGTAAIREARSSNELSGMFDAIREDLAQPEPGLRYYGGVSFTDPPSDDGPWSEFPMARFTVPLIEAGHRDQQYYLACNIALSEDGDHGRAIEDGVNSLKTCAAVFQEEKLEVEPPLSRSDSPEGSSWTDAVQNALAAIDEGPLEKVVLARESSFVFETPPDPIALLRKLADRAAFSYDFCFQPSGRTAFIGASPERLYKRQREYLQSEALAGTRPRGASSEEDEALGKELLTCQKELHEHRIVLERIGDVFESHCSIVRPAGKPGLLKLGNCQHLWTRVEGVLREDTQDEEILDTLHPTPAVGGLPTVEALEHIAKAEPFERGWWAGPVGWMGHDTAEFAVAIRSGLIAGATLSVCTGVGLVPGSEPLQEWEELECKISDFLQIFEEAALALESA